MSDSAKPVRIAMLGSGFVADFYVQGLADVLGHEVAANYSRSSARVEDFARNWGIRDYTTDADGLIARQDLDLYIIPDLAWRCIEAARYFFGKDDRIIEVMAWGATFVHGGKTLGEDNALLVLKFEGGGMRIASCRGPRKAGSIYATRYMARKARSSRM